MLKSWRLLLLWKRLLYTLIIEELPKDIADIFLKNFVYQKVYMKYFFFINTTPQTERERVYMELPKDHRMLLSSFPF